MSQKSAACSRRRYARDGSPRQGRSPAQPASPVQHRGPAPGVVGPAQNPAAVPRPGREGPCPGRHSPPHDASLNLDLPEARVGHGGGRRDCAAPRRACAEPPARAAPPERAGAPPFPPCPAQWRGPGSGGAPSGRSRPAPVGIVRARGEGWERRLGTGVGAVPIGTVMVVGWRVTGATRSRPLITGFA